MMEKRSNEIESVETGHVNNIPTFSKNVQATDFNAKIGISKKSEFQSNATAV